MVDANGSLINGVAVQEEFGAKEIQVTGAQGKGDGTAEFILGRGQDVKVVRDADGRDVTSEVARGMVTTPGDIPYETLIGGQYCTDDASCKLFVDAAGLLGPLQLDGDVSAQLLGARGLAQVWTGGLPCSRERETAEPPYVQAWQVAE